MRRRPEASDLSLCGQRCLQTGENLVWARQGGIDANPDGQHLVSLRLG